MENCGNNMEEGGGASGAGEEAIRRYLADIDRKRRTGVAREHTYRGCLETLLGVLLPAAEPVNEAAQIECGAPDITLIDRKSRLSVGYVEAKDIDSGDLSGKKTNKAQFDRYRAALGNIVFTDYIEFVFCRSGEPDVSVRIAETGDGGIRPLSANFPLFASLVERMGAAAPVTVASPVQLARLMAAKARMLQVAVHKYLSGSPSSDATLLSLLAGFRRVLLPDVTSEEFSDIYAQTLTYGMFAARLHDPTPENFSRSEAAGLIPQSNPFLKRLFSHINTGIEKEIEWAVDDVVRLFAASDVAGIMKDYGKSHKRTDPMIHFYEQFLAAYDAGLRKDRGVWYTPLPVVRFIVGAVDELLERSFGFADGMASRDKIEIEVEENAESGRSMTKKVRRIVPKVQILDPAMGTCTFLAECVKRMHGRFAGNEGLWPGFVKDDLIPRLNGFELLMAPYTMAHIKMDMVLDATGCGASGAGRFNLYLANSLVPPPPPGGTLFDLILGDEAREANKIKRDWPVMVVLGNPPYSGESQNKGEWIMHAMEDYKKEPGGKTRLAERNPKWLNDDYVKFIRLAQYYVEKNPDGRGIVAYINPHGFLDNPTFRGMRWNLLKTFDEIYILNLHGNAKKHEVCPDGSKDENVFSIMQGVSINIFVRTGRKPPDAPGKVFYANLWGRRKDKYAFLESTDFSAVDYKELVPSAPMYFFVPKDTRGEEEYNKGFRIDELMPVNSSGVVSANDELNFSFTEEEQREKIADLLSMSEHDWRIKYHRAKDSRDWAYASAVSDAKRKKMYCKAAYRVFDNRFTFYTGTSKGLYTNPRENVMRHFVSNDNIGLVCLKGFPKDNPPCFVTDAIMEHRYWSCSGMQGTDYVFPLWLYEENMGKVERRANLNPEIVGKIEAVIERDAALAYYRRFELGRTWYDVVPVKEISSLEPIPVTPDPTADRRKVKDIFRAMPPVRNLHDGRVVTFPVDVARKLFIGRGPNGLWVAHAFGKIYERCKLAWSEWAAAIPDHKAHRNIAAYHHYVGKISYGGEACYIRFTVREANGGGKNRSEAHDAVVSKVIVYNANGAELSTPAPTQGEDSAPFDTNIVSNVQYAVKGGDQENRKKPDGAFVDWKMALFLSYAADAQERVPPLQIFDYVYAVLHAPEYREKYREFLKTDFPRIPYPASAAQFAAFAKIGAELRETHLLKFTPSKEERATVATFPVPGGNEVDRLEYASGRLWINAAQYFDNVPQEAWDMAIGGYQPAQKWLKDRKGRTLSIDDCLHYRQIVFALLRTRRLTAELSSAFRQHCADGNRQQKGK